MSSSSSLARKTVLITGGTKGIGAATSLLLSSHGANLAVNYSSDESTATSLVSKLGGHDRAIAIKGDAGSLPDITRMVDETVAKFGKIDVVIACAGILPMRDLEATTEEDFDRAHRLMVKGPYFLVKATVPHMPPSSHVILVSTTLTQASTVQPNYLLYNSCKGAIEQMTKVLSKYLGRKGIVVNAVAPDPTATDLFLKGKPEAIVKAIASGNPFGRLGKPEEVAEAFLWLASEGSRWVSGQVVRVNGGMA